MSHAVLELLDHDRLHAAYDRVRQLLWRRRSPQGYWRGRLADSAVSTATAVSALSTLLRAPGIQRPAELRPLIEGGVAWLLRHQHQDGGWGDTDLSYGNISATMLAQAALRLAGPTLSADVEPSVRTALDRAAQWTHSAGRIAALRSRYGVDKTFAVPILANAALAGLVDWREVSPLPFEMACFPQSWYRFLRLPVVSYAIPALVAIGQVRFHHRPPRGPWKWVRQASRQPSLRVLQHMQPTSGGYLEAIPLTSFVVMSLASSGQAQHPVAQRGRSFLESCVGSSGGWPIDVDLATWNTTLVLNALQVAGEDVAREAGTECIQWLLSCQHRQRHPFTGADPGGWGWTDLSGAVPDADDTPGALLALRAVRSSRDLNGVQAAALDQAADEGCRWLLGLQNRDGGWPTFCRGWGRLPFDRSGADLTAHALRALQAWATLEGRSASWTRPWQRSQAAAWRFLQRQQRADGSWIPLWFGNQDDPAEENPIYGTAKVLCAYRDLQRGETSEARRGCNFLADQQRSDGSWGGGPQGGSVEETALAVEALGAWVSRAPGCPLPIAQSVRLGAEWLLTAVEEGRVEQYAPIGFYFAKLWYYEELYPLSFTLAALARVKSIVEPQRRPADKAQILPD